MQAEHAYKPIRFFISAFLVTWIPWFLSAYFSYQKGAEGFQFLFMMVGLFGPFLSALTMIFGPRNKWLRRDFLDRLSFRKINLSFLPVILLLMPFVVLLATALSLVFGQSVDQFTFSREILILKGHGLVGVLILILAPTFEELGWRGYGVDSLRSYFDLFRTSMLFAILWSMWHVPLFFINGYYHHELWNTSIVYVINFFLSVLPGAFLMNWIYYKNSRSITAAILFHFMINFSSILFQTAQFTKCVVTVLLFAVSIIVIMRDEKFFFIKQVSA